MKNLLALLALLPSLALGDVTTGGVSGWDSALGYTKPAFYPITVPTEASAPNKYYINFQAANAAWTACSSTEPCNALSDLAGKTGTDGTGGATYVYIKGTSGQLNTASLTLRGADASNPLVIKPWPSDSTTTVWTAAGGCGISNSNWIQGSGVRYVVFDGGPTMQLEFRGSGCTGNQNGYTLNVNSDDITLYRVRVNANNSGGPGLGVGTNDGANPDNFKFINSEVYNANNYYGVYTGGGANCTTGNSGHVNLEFRNSIFRDIGGRGIQIEPRSRSGNVSSGLIITGNVFRNIGDAILSHAVELAGACSASVSGAIVVTNNLMWDLQGGGVTIPGWSGASFQIYHNTIYDYAKNTSYSLSSHGITCQSNGCATTGVRNNIILGQAGGVGTVFPINRSPTNTGRNLCASACGTDSRTGTPANTFQSTNPASVDFLKQLPTSNGVQQATNVSITPDYFGNVRPSGGGYDIGAGQATVGTPPDPTPTLSLVNSNPSRTLGQAYTLTWTVTDSTSCTASGGWSGSKATSGTASTGNLTASTGFSLTCTGAGGTAGLRPTSSSPCPPILPPRSPSAPPRSPRGVFRP